MNKEDEPQLNLPDQTTKYDLNHQVTSQFYAMAAAFQQPTQQGQYDNNIQQPQPLQQQQAPGSDDLIRQKKETHREVERRRRETINNGIHQLSELIPGGEKNKGRIIMRAIQYIHELRNNEQTNTEKFTLEKMIFERA